MTAKRLPPGTRTPVSGIYEQIGPRGGAQAKRRTPHEATRCGRLSGPATRGRSYVRRTINTPAGSSGGGEGAQGRFLESLRLTSTPPLSAPVDGIT